EGGVRRRRDRYDERQSATQDHHHAARSDCHEEPPRRRTQVATSRPTYRRATGSNLTHCANRIPTKSAKAKRGRRAPRRSGARPAWVTSLIASKACGAGGEVVAFGEAGGTPGGVPVAGRRRAVLAGQFEQVRAGRQEPVVAGHPAVGFQGGEQV